MMKPFFSILMPVYNRAELVRYAIQSIIDQTCEDWEMIVVDDGSEDNTFEVVLKVVEQDSRIKIFHREHYGLVSALNFGNMLCEGKFIVKQDSDDVSLPNRLEVLHRYFTEHPEIDFFYHGMYQTWENEDGSLYFRKSYIPALPVTERILKEQYIPGAFAYSKAFIEKTPYRNLHCSEDWMLILDAYFRKAKIGFVNEGLYECMLKPDSNSLLHGEKHYAEDEEKMKQILLEEYSITGFFYPKR